MTKRPIAIFLLLVAFLVSAWGNVIGAAFCPRYLAQNCHLKHAAQRIEQIPQKSCHEMAGMSMEDMNMDDMQMEGDSSVQNELSDSPQSLTSEIATDSSVDQVVLNLPNEPCGHCWIHSQPSSGTGTLNAVEPSPRSVEAIAAATGITVTLPVPKPITAAPLEHSPPGTTSPRHVLINVFRI